MKAIFASTKDGDFGLNGGLPWQPIHDDLTFFMTTTIGSIYFDKPELNEPNILVMGRKTYETLPKLSGRQYLVVTSTPIPGVACVHPNNLQHKLDVLKTVEKVRKNTVFIIGGASLLVPEILINCDTIYHTEVFDKVESDVKLHPDTLPFVKKFPSEIVLETDRCIIKEYNVKL